MKAPFEKHPEGTLVRVRVNPGARETAVRGVDEWRGVLEIDVSEPPEKGRANKELIRFLKDKTGADVKLLSGETSREKTLLIEGKTPDEVEEALLS